MFNIKHTLKKHQLINIAPVIDGSEFYVIAQIANNTDKDIIFVARDDERANTIYTACQSFISNKKILYFPAWDTLPYDLTSPSAHILAKRIYALTNIIQNPTEPKIIITSSNAITQKLPLPIEISNSILNLKTNATYNREKLINYLIHHNYIRTSTANAIGEFAVRGNIIDIVVNSDAFGYRIDFFGDTIEQIKIFDVESQLSTSKTENIVIMPPSEVILSEITIDNFKRNIIKLYGSNANSSVILQNIERGKLHFTGVEQWLPLFYNQLTNFFEYLSQKTAIIFDYLTEPALNERFEQIQHYYKERLAEVTIDKKLYDKPLEPSALFFDREELNKYTNKYQQIFSLPTHHQETVAQIQTDIKPTENLFHLAKLNSTSALSILHNIIASSKTNLIISSLSNGSRDRIERILQDHDIIATKQDKWDNQTTIASSTPTLIISSLQKGFTTSDFRLITEQEIFGERIQNAPTKKQKQFKQLTQEANNFSIGEIVVHIDHGIGKFEGLETIALSSTKHDCLKISYDGGDILYVPIENVELVSKYGLEGEVKLDKLGSASWQARKAKLKNRIKVSAEYLLNIAAERLTKTCDEIIPSIGIYDEFCATFPYQETEDQLTTMSAIQSDLSAGTPMDRLVCGDVGFGKTEIAIRAAFITMKANDNVKRQVAVICPTTLLCKQHFKVFADRFKNFNITIKQLSRFISKKEMQQTIEGINNGTVDIVISTHALFNQKIKFSNLALIIIDEEQHFGVIQKEKLKEKKSNVHVLSLSATPIPRTLQMSLTGIKDLSIIATPPVNRLVTKTSVLPYDPIIIKEAMLREFHRGGQIFYVCPRISDMDDVIKIVSSLAPELRIVSAHGQMTPDKLEKTMHEFYDHKFDILICTSIVESGLDLPNVNTIIVHRSDKFGLSQLYQLRGRVGRGKHKAYAYFTIPNHNLQPNVIKRLEILQTIDSLGAGFSVASHDMDVRGFGNLLGDEQSGHIREVGIELYQEMLEQTLKALKTDNKLTEIEEKWTPQLNLGLSVLIPENYIQDLDLRLNLYQRIASLEDEKEIEAFAVEMIDRFGPLPAEFDHLISIVKLKRLCIQNHIRKIDAGPKAIMLEFSDKNFDKTEQLLKLVKTNPDQVKLKPENKVLLNNSIENPIKRIELINRFIKRLNEV